MKLVVEDFSPLGTIKKIHTSERMVSTSSSFTYTYRESQLNHRSPMIDKLLDIQGITEIIMRPYCLQITIGRVFSWDNLQPRVTYIIEKYAKETDL